MKVFAETLGCKVNQYETQAMLSLLEHAGFSVAERAQDSDVILVNSCTVTAVSDSQGPADTPSFAQKCPYGCSCADRMHAPGVS